MLSKGQRRTRMPTFPSSTACTISLLDHTEKSCFGAVVKLAGRLQSLYLTSLYSQRYFSYCLTYLQSDSKIHMGYILGPAHMRLLKLALPNLSMGSMTKYVVSALFVMTYCWQPRNHRNCNSPITSASVRFLTLTIFFRV